MNWQEEEQQRMMRDALERGERGQTKQKKILKIVGIVVFVGIAVLSIDMATRDKGTRLPIDLADPKGTVAAWENSGFLKSVNTSSTTVEVDENTWNETSKNERTAIAVFLGTYCAQQRGEAQVKLTLKGSASQSILATIDSVGMTVQ